MNLHPIGTAKTLDTQVNKAGIFSGMNSHSESKVLEGLGNKVTASLSLAVALTAQDLRKYREVFPSFVSQSSERGLANWIHDRLWVHLNSLLDGHPDVTLSEGEPTRELVVGMTYRLRVKRHREGAQVSSYPTQTALEFFAQGVQDMFPGFEEVRLIAGYQWEPDAREIGEAVLSLRDGKDNIIWHLVLPAPETGISGIGGSLVPIQPVGPQVPALPAIVLPETERREAAGEDAT